jgi:lipoprotein-anchoring transpeptidase ErfK/SrfK
MAAPSVGHSGALSGRPMLPWLAGTLALVVVVLVSSAYLYERSRRDTIADGVRIAGVAVGGLNAQAARAKLERDLVARLQQPVTIKAGTRTWTLRPDEAEVRVEVDRMVSRAVSVSREGSIFTRASRDLFGGGLDRDVPLAIGYSHRAVRSLTDRIRASVDRPSRDATVEPLPDGLRTVPSAVGLTVDRSRLGALIDETLVGRAPSRSVRVPTHAVQPAVTTASLAARYPAYIVIDRASFRLSFYSHLRLEHTYEIAVGMEGLETPAGLHRIEWEQVNPPWYVPKKAWAGALAGTVVPPGPADPLKARFMAFDGGAGIHGIDPSEYATIGHDASHGCVRMRIPDVIDLYSKSPVGTPVYII